MGLGPGPQAARLFHTLLGLVSIAAWLSLGSQVLVLTGKHGLLPAREFFERARAAELGFLEAPSLLWLAHGDAALHAGIMAGLLASLCVVAGVGARIALGINALLYLSYTVACDTFLSFQWDNMLVEACVLAACLSRTQASPLAGFALRCLLFKLYFESGIAKWQSPIGDFIDGSAMTFYYETAPIPTWLAWHAHHLPAGVHRFESWAALFMELVVPFFVFGPRLLRLIACTYFTGFLVIDTATANYGFFTYLSLCLNVFLLSDGDLERVKQLCALRVPRMAAWFATDSALTPSPAPPRRALRALQFATLACWVGASAVGGVTRFTEGLITHPALLAAYERLQPFRVANVYHLFGQITRERYEPEFQTQQGGAWTGHAMHYKPGPVDRPPPLVAPHQPRVDFRLWFYGLSFSRGTPRFVNTLLQRLCHAPARVQPLFVERLPRHPEAVRVVFHRYRFSTPEQRTQTGAFWVREEIGSTQPLHCR